jgi:predicted nuclease with TOPRIM domain
MSFLCCYCNKEFKSEKYLEKHKITAKYCLKIQEGSSIIKYNTTEYKTTLDKKDKEIENFKNKYMILKSELALKNMEFEELKDETTNLVNKLRELEIELKVKNELLFNQQFEKRSNFKYMFKNIFK